MNKDHLKKFDEDPQANDPHKFSAKHWEAKGYQIDRDSYPWVAFKMNDQNKIEESMAIMTDREYSFALVIHSAIQSMGIATRTIRGLRQIVSKQQTIIQSLRPQQNPLTREIDKLINAFKGNNDDLKKRK